MVEVQYEDELWKGRNWACVFKHLRFFECFGHPGSRRKNILFGRALESLIHRGNLRLEIYAHLLLLLQVQFDLLLLKIARYWKLLKLIGRALLPWFKLSLARDAELISLFTLEATFLLDSDTLQNTPTVATYFIKLVMASFNSPSLEAIKQAFHAQLDEVGWPWRVIEVDLLKVVSC